MLGTQNAMQPKTLSVAEVVSVLACPKPEALTDTNRNSIGFFTDRLLLLASGPAGTCDMSSGSHRLSLLTPMTFSPASFLVQ
jgi:hypothetical protein